MMKRIFALAAILAAVAPAAYAHETVQNKAVPAGELQYFVAADPIEFSVVTGDLANGPQGTFGKFPANFKTPEHTHTNSYQAVVISGQMTNPFAGDENPPILGPGSFWSVQAKAPHATACISDEPCEFFMFATQGFDFEVVE